MRKIDLFKRVKRIDDSILDLTKSGRKVYPEVLTCKDLKRLIEALNTIYELFDKCMKENKE